MKASAKSGPLAGLRAREFRMLLHPQRVLKRIVSLAVRETGAGSGSFVLLNPNTGLLDIEATSGLGKRAAKLKLKPGEGITGWVASTGKPFRVGDVRLERRYVAVHSRIRSEMAVPVEIRHQVIGILNVDSNRINAFSDADEKRLLALARDAAEWLQLSWDIDLLRHTRERLAMLLDIGQTIIAQPNLDEALQQVAQNGCRLMKAKLCSLMLISADQEELRLRAAYGAGIAYINKPNLKVGESLVGVVVKRRQPLVVVNVQEHHSYRHTELARQEGLVSLLSVPLVFGQGLLGVMSVYTDTLHRFSNDEIKLLSALADWAAVAIEKAQLLQKVVDMEEKLRTTERLSALGLLAAEVAHEIRNPLTVMQMLFHALVEDLKLTGAHARDSEVISEKMAHMNRIVDQILKFARSSEPIKSVINPSHLIDDICLLTRHKLQQQKVDIRSFVSTKLPVLLADRQQLEQALLNLVLNAADAMPHGGNLRLTATRETVDGVPHVVLGIRDNGPGMSKRQQDNLFQPFLTTKAHGTGIGLAIVRRVVEHHQGKIEVDSKPGKGTHFRLLLPVLTDEVPAAAAPVEDSESIL